ncbi:hypothetical protein HanXRQr2_Chr04g0142681 [Helianthus annuus]|uniref:Uncharacterized protein n=1 Tax=Helianthus annuus TaxID=4232 RepID=A0A9K3J3K9_HELAN|nr:hypothetical protein HanXRQr2_Chr04g0142681 [Helianthus annuus]KAJ0929528.1 hypothetical protein HanPSC8_Chr04g0138661 [Helianthus annuus]
MENETLGYLATRFNHLLSEMFSFKVVATPQEMVARFADALPMKWSGFMKILKRTGSWTD